MASSYRQRSTTYDMSGAKKALMLCAMTAKQGGESDMQIMRCFFSQFGFGGYGTNIIPNASAMQMRENIQRFRNNIMRDQQHISCIMVSVSCHGSVDELAGVDANRIKVSEIIEPFSDDNCPRLKGIPKIFILDACRGDVEDEGVHRYSPQQMDTNMKILRYRTNYAPPVINDMFTVYPAMLGYATFGTDKGGFLHLSIQEVFQKEWPRNRGNHLDDLFLEVKKKFQAMHNRHPPVVVALVESTLRKLIYL
ncbi:caspase-14-like isoform X1 [Sinocyclocheilus grahami]|uniref:caspase-14-like isoform X1 n=1 Tax=Sinocyclocheilus grahami TaxID=75366 RepID=UPI0007AC9E3B|nr:PREDICTED: caspase-14-like isoform X1 [Sinocyclocheilus grahami]